MATACVAGAVVAAAGAVLTSAIHTSVSPTVISYPYSPGVFRITETLVIVTHVLTALGPLALIRSGLLGPGRLARAGSALAVLGMALIVPAELGFALFPSAGNQSTTGVVLGAAMGLSVTIAGLGFVLAGVAALRARRWPGYGRWTPLLAGAYVFVVMLPVMAAAPSLLFWGIAGWYTCFALLGIALRSAARAS